MGLGNQGMFDEDKRYKIVICDDDETFIDLLSEKIEQDFVQRKIVCLIEKYSDSRKLLDNIGAETQLYFLDIDMPEINGMEIADKILAKNPHSEIIFVSNHEEMVFESFRYKPLRFIRKERMNQELQEAISAFLDKKEKESRILEITTREGKCCIAVDDIIFLESRQHYLKICCENENFELRGRISDYETMLEKYGFVRVNIGFIINCKYIKILKTKKIILCNGMEINIGSNRHDKVRHAYMEYVREKNKWKL